MDGVLMDTVEMWFDEFDTPFVLQRLTLPQIAVLRDSCTVDGKIDEVRLLVGTLALGVISPKMTTAKSSQFCADHFEVAAKLWARLAEMLE
jgi:hypothetical protein